MREGEKERKRRELKSEYRREKNGGNIEKKYILLIFLNHGISSIILLCH